VAEKACPIFVSSDFKNNLLVPLFREYGMIACFDSTETVGTKFIDSDLLGHRAQNPSLTKTAIPFLQDWGNRRW